MRLPSKVNMENFKNELKLKYTNDYLTTDDISRELQKLKDGYYISKDVQDAEGPMSVSEFCQYVHSLNRTFIINDSRIFTGYNECDKSGDFHTAIGSQDVFNKSSSPLSQTNDLFDEKSFIDLHNKTQEIMRRSAEARKEKLNKEKNNDSKESHPPYDKLREILRKYLIYEKKKIKGTRKSPMDWINVLVIGAAFFYGIFKLHDYFFEIPPY